VDASGIIYVADTKNAVIRKITPDGVVTTLAGLVGAVDLKDGVGFSARFESPLSIAVDGSGNVYVTDNGTSIRKVTPAGIVTTVAGGKATGAVNGTGSGARFNGALGIAVDRNGDLYITDIYNAVIRKVLQSGVVTTFAGQMGVEGNQDGTGAGATFTRPNGITIDSSGNLFVNDYLSNIVRKITPTGVVTTIAGRAFAAGRVDANGANARFDNMHSMAVDGNGNVYVAEDRLVRKITPAGDVTTIAGTFGRLGSADGGLGTATFGKLAGLALNGNAGLVAVDQVNCSLRRVGFDGAVSTLNGAGLIGHADGTGEQARFASPNAIAVDIAGNVYVADADNLTIRKITPAGLVSTIAGTPQVAGPAVDGPAAAAKLNSPGGIAVAPDGTVYFTQWYTRHLRKITPTGQVVTVAGSGTPGAVDGLGSAAAFANPRQIALDAAGNLYVLDGETTVRKVTPAGMVTTLAGKPGQPGAVDGPASTALLGRSDGIALDSSGNI
jgi:sugar lactone lactonase YvrE